jgi:hypothetical protein
MIAVAGCAHAGPTDPYSNGRLVHPAYVEIVGEPAEIAPIKAHGVEQGWSVVCEGRVGQEAALRLRFPSGTARQAIESYFGAMPFLTEPRGRKLQMIYHGMARSSGCISLP